MKPEEIAYMETVFRGWENDLGIKAIEEIKRLRKEVTSLKKELTRLETKERIRKHFKN